MRSYVLMRSDPVEVLGMADRPFRPLILLFAWLIGLLAVSALPTLAAGAPTTPSLPPLLASSPKLPNASTSADDAVTVTPSVPGPGNETAVAEGAPPDHTPPRPAETPSSTPDRQSQGPALAPEPPPGESELWIEVSVGEQTVRVYRGNDLVRAMKASTGRPETPTPLGSFRLVGRGEWFYNPKYRAGGFWWVSFVPSGEYLFHSIPADARRRLLPEAAALLGQPASRGCVRLSLDDARWVYEHVPTGTRVLIHAATGPFAGAFAARDKA